MRSKISIITVIFVLAVGLFTAAGRPIEWTFQADHSPGDPAYEYMQGWADDIYRASGGRLRITIHPPGAIVPFMEVFKAVSMGVLDGAATWGPYWIGVDPVFGIFCGSAAGMTPEESALWRQEWGGREMIAEKYTQFNIHWLPSMIAPAELFLWARQPIRTFADLEGLKVRSAGLSLVMFGRLGVAAHWIPGGETPPALLKGVVDAGEFMSFPSDMGLGFHEAASYAMKGPRAPSVSSCWIINMDRWNELPPDLQAIVTTVSREFKSTMLWRLQKLEIEAMRKAVEVHGITIVHIEECLAKLVRQTFDEMFDEFAAQCPFFARVWESQRAFLEEYRAARPLLWPWQ